MKTSILKLKNILLTSISEDISDHAALDFQEVLLRNVAATEAKGVVIDISGMDLVDSYLARVLNDTATMVRILGTQVVLCGMQPAVALTLIEMGRGLLDIDTALDLEQGFEMIQKVLINGTGGASSEKN